MQLSALSHYENDTDTRFGDCILVFEQCNLIVYDCGHPRHADHVKHFLEEHPRITSVYIVVSHNDSDHTAGICDLLNYLHDQHCYTVQVFAHLYLKHVDEILDVIDDGRRSRERLKEHLLEEFNHIREIVETAEQLHFMVVEALPGTAVANGRIVGPTKEEFIETAAKAVDKRENNIIEEETVMNAASVQLKCYVDNMGDVLLCGDAAPSFLHSINDYDIIQLPHHGQLDDAQAVFKQLQGDSYKKVFLVSDNTGSSKTSGGSDDLVEYMRQEQYTPAKNTRNGIVDLPSSGIIPARSSDRRTYLG